MNNNDIATIAAHILKYNDEAYTFLARIYNYENADAFIADNQWILTFDFNTWLNEHKQPSPVPLYRGGVGNWFYTPDKTIAREYRREGTLFQWLFGLGPAKVVKLPAGTPCVIGHFYPNLSPLTNTPGYEVIVNPDWL